MQTVSAVVEELREELREQHAETVEALDKVAEELAKLNATLLLFLPPRERPGHKTAFEQVTEELTGK